MAIAPVCALDYCRKWHHRSAIWHAPIAAEDQARVIATILAKPAAHVGKTYTFCGPTELDQAGIAAAISEVLGRKISYEPLTIPQYRERLEKAGLSEFMIQHFVRGRPRL